MNTIAGHLVLRCCFHLLSYGAPGGTISGTVETPGRLVVQGSICAGPERKKQNNRERPVRQAGGIPDPKPYGRKVSGPGDGGGLQEATLALT